MGLQQRGIGSGNPGPPASPCSPPTFSGQSWQQGPLCGTICDHSCMYSLRFCPTGAWKLPSTLRKVLTRCC